MFVRFIIGLILALTTTIAHADSISKIVGGEVSKDALVCVLGAPTFLSSLSITTGANDIQSFDIDAASSRWAAIIRRSVDNVPLLYIGSTSPLNVSSVTPLPAGTESGARNPVFISGSNVWGVFGQTTVAGCGGLRCFRLMNWNTAGVVISQNDFSLTFGSQVNNAVFDGTNFFTMNRDNGGGTTEVMWHLTTTPTEAASAAHAVTPDTESGIALNGSSQVIVSSGVISQFQRWTQAAVPVFVSTTATSCAAILESVAVSTSANAIYTSCNGRVNHADLTTGIESFSNGTGLSGVGTYNALAYSANVGKVYYGVRTATGPTLYQLNSNTLTLEATASQVIANANSSGLISNQIQLDDTQGNVYIAGNLTGGGAYIAKFSICTPK